MKKRLFSLIVVGIVFGFLVIPTGAARAQEALYILPSPSVLPDHPLYILKKIRNKLIERLLCTPKQKVTFYLSQADVGFSETAMMVRKGNRELAKKTALRAENYYTLLVSAYHAMIWTPTPFSVAEEKALKDAAHKHQEILEAIISTSMDGIQTEFQQILDFSKANEKRIGELKTERERYKEKKQ